MYEIRSNIPVPKTLKKLRESKYPFKHMLEGDCFIVPVEDVPTRGVVSIKLAAYHFKRTRKLDWAFTIASLDDGSIGVWRVA